MRFQGGITAGRGHAGDNVGSRAVLAAIGGYHLLSAFDLAVEDREALRIANQNTDFPVGHASAAVGFEGWRARPVWNVLVFSADDPPANAQGHGDELLAVFLFLNQVVIV